MNKVVLVGRLTAKPELSSKDETVYSRFSLAVNRNYKDANGERGVDFINVIAWGKNAENITTYLEKGSLIALDGSIITGSYDDKDGNKHYTFDVNLDHFEFMESKKDTPSEEPTTL